MRVAVCSLMMLMMLERHQNARMIMECGRARAYLAKCYNNIVKEGLCLVRVRAEVVALSLDEIGGSPG